MNRVNLILLSLFCAFSGSGCSKRPPHEPWKQLEGEWAFVQRNEKGKVIPDGELKKLEFVVHNDSLLIMRGGVVKKQYHLNVDPSKNPPEVDLVITDGDDQGRAEKGIYELEGNSLKLCTADVGRKRPTELAAKAKSPWTYSVLQRK